MWLWVSVGPSFSLLYNIPQCDYTVLYPSLFGAHLGWSQTSYYCKTSVSVSASPSTASGCAPRSGVAGTQLIWVVSSMGRSPSVFQGAWTIHTSSSNFLTNPVDPHPHQHIDLFNSGSLVNCLHLGVLLIGIWVTATFFMFTGSVHLLLHEMPVPEFCWFSCQVD